MSPPMGGRIVVGAISTVHSMNINVEGSRDLDARIRKNVDEGSSATRVDQKPSNDGWYSFNKIGP